MVSSYYTLELPLVLSTFSISALFSTKHLPHPFNSVILHNSQHHVVSYSFLFITPFVTIFPFLFLLFSNISTAVSTVRATLDINHNSFMPCFISCRALNSRDGSPHTLLMWRNFTSRFAAVLMDQARKWSVWCSARLPNRNNVEEIHVSEQWLWLGFWDRHWQLWLVVLASLTVHLYAKKDARIAEYIIPLFLNRGVAIPECAVSGICDRITRCGIGLLCKKSRIGGWGNSTKGPYCTATELGCWRINVFVSERAEDTCIIVYIVPKCFPKVKLKTKMRLVPFIVIQHYSIFFFAMAFSMSAHLCKDSTAIWEVIRWISAVAELIVRSLLLSSRSWLQKRGGILPVKHSGTLGRGCFLCFVKT